MGNAARKHKQQLQAVCSAVGTAVVHREGKHSVDIPLDDAGAVLRVILPTKKNKKQPPVFRVLSPDRYMAHAAIERSGTFGAA